MGLISVLRCGVLCLELLRGAYRGHVVQDVHHLRERYLQLHRDRYGDHPHLAKRDDLRGRFRDLSQLLDDLCFVLIGVPLGVHFLRKFLQLRPDLRFVADTAYTGRRVPVVLEPTVEVHLVDEGTVLVKRDLARTVGVVDECHTVAGPERDWLSDLSGVGGSRGGIERIRVLVAEWTQVRAAVRAECPGLPAFGAGEHGSLDVPHDGMAGRTVVRRRLPALGPREIASTAGLGDFLGVPAGGFATGTSDG